MKKILASFVMIFFLTFSIYAEKPVTTVLDFEVNSVSKGDMKSIISFLSASLFDTGKYRVIDTAQRDTILNELEFSLSGCSDDSCQLEIGKLLSAEFIVTGDIAKVGTRYILSARMLETETSETAGTAKGIYQTLDELIDDMPSFADTLAGVETEAVDVADKVEPVVPAEPVFEVRSEEPEKTSSVESAGANRILAWSTLGAGVAMTGTGTYFLVDSIIKLNTASDAEAAYIAATSTADADTLYDAYETAYNAAGNSNTMFWLGAGLIGGGVVSAAVSVIFFLKDNEASDEQIAVAFGPQSFAVRLSY